MNMIETSAVDEWLASMRLFGIPVLSFIAAGVGAFVGEYLKKKGEALATKEDLKNVLEQIRATTETTKSIEARISNESWNRQTQWQLRRDILFQLVGGVAKLEGILRDLYVSKLLDTGASDEEKKKHRSERRELEHQWSVQTIEFYNTRLLARLICTTETRESLLKFQELIQGLSVRVAFTEGVILQDVRELQSHIERVTEDIRKELGIQDSPTPQSSESSAAPALAPQAPE